MATATTSNSLTELVAEADQLELEYRGKRSAIMARIRDAANAEAGDFQVDANNNGSAPSASAATTSPPPKRRRSQTAKKTTGKTNPKAPAKKKTAAKKSGKVKPDDRNYDNKVSLRECIWNVLDRGPDSWAKSIEDFPADAEGLKVSEVKEIIENEGLWESSSENISPQVQQHLYELKKKDKVARGDDRRYYIVEGATL